MSSILFSWMCRNSKMLASMVMRETIWMPMTLAMTGLSCASYTGKVANDVQRLDDVRRLIPTPKRVD